MSEFPNKATQFKKGNPGGGHPKGVKNRATILKKWIEVNVKIRDKANPTKKEQSGTVEDTVILALLNKAIAGDISAIKEINDTLYGKIKEQTELSGSIILPITGVKIIKDDT
jgi:hypothetical protein